MKVMHYFRKHIHQIEMVIYLVDLFSLPWAVELNCCSLFPKLWMLVIHQRICYFLFLLS